MGDFETSESQTKRLSINTQFSNSTLPVLPSTSPGPKSLQIN